MNKNKIFENILVYIFFSVFLIIGYRAISSTNNEQSEKLKVNFLDVGQGDATLIETPTGEQILIDSGPDKSVLNELGEILPIFDRKIDVLVLSHPHADHLSGFNYILDRYEVGEVLITGVINRTPDSELFFDKVKEYKINVNILTTGDKVCLERVCLDILWPDEDEITKYDMNDTSMAFNVNYGEIDFVFLGDLSAEVQERIIERFNFDAEIIKVSHHGSKTGTSRKIIEKIRPEIAVISVGENNYFHHPSNDVLNILDSLKVFRTDVNGTVTITSDGKTIQY